MTLRAILFDHDGTMVNSEPVHCQMWIEILARRDICLTEAQYREHYAGLPTAANAQDMVHRFSIEVDPRDLVHEKGLATQAYLRHQAYPLMNGVAEAIRELRDMDLLLGVVTGANAFGAEATLRWHDLENAFSVVVSGDDVQLSKPAPDCYLLAMKRLGLKPAECLAVEDTQHGLASAHAAGALCVVVPTQMSRMHDFGLADAVLTGMEDLVGHVQLRLTGTDGARP